MSEESPHKSCTAHSGLTGRMNLVATLLVFILSTLVYQINQTSVLHGELTLKFAVLEVQQKDLATRVISNGQKNKNIEVKLDDLEDRVGDIERKIEER